MDRGDVPATLELLQSEEFRSLRGLSENDDYLKTARDWGLNRYRLRLSYSLSRQLEGEGSQASFLGEIWRFVSHYSPVWLALPVGAILMLDFGDPWTTMTREGATKGIGITFGSRLRFSRFWPTSGPREVAAANGRS